MTFEKRFLVAPSLVAALFLAACSSDSNGGGGSGGKTTSGGQTSSSGGASNGGSTSGGASNGGSGNGGSNASGSGNGGSGTGGATNTNGGQTGSNGGSSAGGSSNGGSANGGSSSGGKSNGGSSNGGSANGGSSNGGSNNAGSANGGASNAGAGNGGSSGGGSKGPTGYTCPSVAAGTNPLPSNPTATPIAGVPPADSFNNNNNDFKILEGPVWFQDALYFSEIKNGSAPPPSRVLKVTSAGAVSVAIPQANAGTNGLAIDASGNLIGANHTLGAIVRLDPTGAAAPTVIVGTYMNQRFNSPNDLTVRSDGNIYFTDPQHQAGSTKMTMRAYRIAPNATMATIIQDNANAPNGITLSIDGSTLFLSHGPDSGGIDKYPVNPDGSLGTASQLTSAFSSDGMGIDCAGNLYLSQSNKIVVISSTTGQKVGEIPVNDVQQATNVAFGGPDHKTLYITSLGNNAKLLKIELNVPGMPY